jgi:hypothetical protein
MRFVDDLPVAELHDAYRLCQSPRVRYCVFREPEIPVFENPSDVEAGRLAGMMTSQGLQIPSPENSLARLRIITNGIVIVNIVFRICIAVERCVPVSNQGCTNLFLLYGLFQLCSRFHVHLPCGMKPGTPVFTTSFSLCLV